MTELMIVAATAISWWSRGNYNPLAPVLTLFFLGWVLSRFYGRLEVKNRAIREAFFLYYPWFGATLMALRPSVLYFLDPLRPALAVFRLIPALILGSTVRIKERAWIVSVLFLAFFLSTLVLSPHPLIDVFTTSSEAVDYLIKGLNPYSQAYTDIYGGAFNYQPVFVYWPGALYLQTISKLVFFDVRVVLVLAWWSAAFLLSDRLSARLAWWSIPFLAFGFEQAWLDPIIAFCAVLCLRSVERKQWHWLGVAMALAAATKQYGFLVGLFSSIYLVLHEKPSRFWKPMVIGAALFCLMMAPWLLQSPRDFVNRTILSLAHVPARVDALNFSAFWVRSTGRSFSSSAQLALTSVGFILAGAHLLRKRRAPEVSVIAESCAIAFGFSIFFGNFAFSNYHWLLISFWMMALAFERSIKTG